MHFETIFSLHVYSKNGSLAILYSALINEVTGKSTKKVRKSYKRTRHDIIYTQRERQIDIDGYEEEREMNGRGESLLIFVSSRIVALFLSLLPTDIKSAIYTRRQSCR